VAGYGLWLVNLQPHKYWVASSLSPTNEAGCAVECRNLSLKVTIETDVMGAESSSSLDIEVLEKKIAAAIENAGSLREIEAWFRSQQYVKSMELTEYLLKSNPPQRDFIVEFGVGDGPTVKKIVNIFDLGNGQFRFHKLRDE
jgi:hypothetical protein